MTIRTAVAESRKLREGVVSALHYAQGYGFLISEDDPREVFFHAQSVVSRDFDNLTVGDEVLYRQIETEKGLRAVGVRRKGGSNGQ